MEGIIHRIQGLSSKQDDWRSLVQQLDNNVDLLCQNRLAIDELYAQLNPESHAIGCVYLLYCKTKESEQCRSEEILIQQVRDLCMFGDSEQLKIVRSKFCDVCRVFTEICRQSASRAMFGINPLCIAISKVRPSPEHLTSVHADMLQLCLVGKVFKPAMSVVSQRLLYVTKDCVQPRDFLLYYYYGGMIQTALKDYNKALDMFQLAFTMPCHALNEILVETYKKYVLVSLIVHGEVQPLPKYSANIVQRLIKSCCSEYNEIANACSANKLDELRNCVEKHKNLLTKNQNLGLAMQVIDSGSSRSIQRLTETFVTLSLTDIAQEVKLPDAESARSQVLRMIERGQIVATIDEEKGMVSFDTEPDKATSQQLLLRLSKQIQVAMELNEKLRQADEEISANAAYLSKVSNQERQLRWGDSEWAATGAEEMMDVGEKPAGFNFGRPS
uniref:COP9 signalosome complex subunit 3 n=1 Tax=Hanusia phi TaxID=3032 RepID=A0A7S0F2X9_9CRYP|mmetsp:Transcript_3563/g.8747  ORF Transcript_3563/g.8747 Transcript_3563/m.8747 type:complete len:443 (+) Transcript_3563:56-1384(+)